jgi:hypothetical protein
MSGRALPLAALLLGLCATGCSTVGNGRLVQLDAPQARLLLVPGRTSREDIRQTFGQGTVIRFQSGFETWHYLYREGIAPGWDEVPYVGLITSRLDRPTKELLLLFDADGVLKRWSLQEFRGAAPRGT